MEFILRISSHVEERERRNVVLEVSGLSKEPYSVELERLVKSSSQIEERFWWDQRGYPLHLGIAAYFLDGKDTIRTSAVLHNGVGLDIVQIRPRYILANFLHGKIETATGQCTVKCESTGESRTGRNICIECASEIGTIKICC